MTYEHKIKCISCQLHFTAYSWDENWKVKYCPECGTTAGFMHWRSDTDKHIFQLVPGDAGMIGMGV